MKELKGLGEKVAIHCPTETEAMAYCEIMHSFGRHWKSGGPDWESYLNNNKWNVNREKTVYYPVTNQYGHLDNADGFTILPASKFLALNQPEPEKKPAWVFESDEEFCNFMEDWFRDLSFDPFRSWLALKRKPQFELITEDDVKISDPEQWVFVLTENGPTTRTARETRSRCDQSWSTLEAVNLYVRSIAQKICLKDLEGIISYSAYYQMEKLVNQRMK